MRHASHCAVGIEDFDQTRHRLESGQASQVNSGFGVSGARQDSAVLCVERIDMSGASEPFGASVGIGQGANGRRTVVCRDTGGASFEQVHGYGEGRAEHRCIGLDLVLQLQLATAFLGDRRAKHAASELKHVVDFLGSNEFCGRNQVAFVFSVLVIDDNNEFPGFEVLKGFFYSGKLYFGHGNK